MDIEFSYETEMWANPYNKGDNTYLFEFKITACGSKGYPGKTWGHPDNWQPSEPDNVEDFQFELIRVTDNFNELPITKVTLTEREFLWWFGKKEMDDVERAAYDMLEYEYGNQDPPDPPDDPYDHFW